VLAIVGLMTLAGCGSLGPKTVVRDTFNYNAAVAESSKNQLLQNIVRIRYADMPIFLEVSSIVNQYEVKTNASARIDSELAPFTFGGSYTERPTLSYTPLSGEKFIRSLMTPLAPEIVLHLVEVGWPAELVLGLSVQAINGIYNHSGGGLIAHEDGTRFDSLLSSIASIQRSGVLVSEIEKHDGDTDMLLMFRDHPNTKVQSEITSVMKLLMLDPNLLRFRVSAGICPTESDEIKLRTRSILMIIQELAMGIERCRMCNERRQLTPTSDPSTTVRGCRTSPFGAAKARLKTRTLQYSIEIIGSGLTTVMYHPNAHSPLFSFS